MLFNLRCYVDKVVYYIDTLNMSATSIFDSPSISPSTDKQYHWNY